MRIAVSADSPDLKGKVERRFGLSAYYLIVDPFTMAFEAIANPAGQGQAGAGIQAVILLINKKVDAVLTGYCSPTAMKYLSQNDISVHSDISGTVAEALAEFKTSMSSVASSELLSNSQKNSERLKNRIRMGLKQTFKQMMGIMPILLSVVLLMGLFEAFVPIQMLLAYFSQSVFQDIFWGNILGSVLTTNPVNSYVIGQTLLEKGVSLYAVTALISAWVTVGVVQLPVEIDALGCRFALVRNGLFFIVSMVIALLTVGAYGLIVN
jgi:predicted Fe-Mo cluster-binding NifX family protein